MSDDFYPSSDDRRKWKDERLARNLSTIKTWCYNTNGCVYFKIIQPTQIRLSGEGKEIDIYPLSKKFRDIKKKKRGLISVSFRKFLSSFFNLPY